MTNKDANKTVQKLFNRFKKLKTNSNKDYYNDLEELKKYCKDIHDVSGVYKVLSPLNVVKMGAMNSTIRFVEPYQMLMQMQKTVKVY